MTTQQSFLFTTQPAAPETRAPESPARRNLVIEAGAGTGKTTRIVAEVLRLLLGDAELAPERIVLVTFTEKAAGEIADRIHEALSELESRLQLDDDRPICWPVDSPRPPFALAATQREEALRAARAQLARIDSLRSQTIHSFCQSLLRQFPIEAGLDPQFRIIEGFERSLLYGQLYDSWLDDETRVAPKPEHLHEWEVLINHFGYLFQVRDMVFALAERRDLLGEERHDFGELAEIEDAIKPAIDLVRIAKREQIEALNDDDTRLALAYIHATTPPSTSSLDAWIDYFEPIATNLRDANLPAGKVNAMLKEALRVLRADEQDSDGKWKKAGRSMFDVLASHRAALALFSLTRRFLASLDAGKKQLGVVDFDDLLLRTVDLLDDEAVVARVRAQYDYLFVDEFQDTDRTQARIIDRLARDRSGAFVPGKTILVGDPKQSIYGFRRADPETYHRLTSALVDGGAARDFLEDQYRSDPDLLASINALFGCLFPNAPHDPNIFRPSYHPLRAGKPQRPRESGAPITFLGVEHDERADQHIEEAETICAWITAHRDRSEHDLQRFAILFRRLTKLDDYLDALERHRIDYVLPPTRLFLDRRAPVDLLAVLRAIAYPFDRGAEVSAARTPYFALTDTEIASWWSERLDTESSEPPSNIAYEQFRMAIGRYRELARQSTVTEVIDLVIAATSIETLYAATADGPRAERHLEHLRHIAFTFDQTTGGSLRQFVDEIERRRGEPDEAEPSLVDETRNAIRILSVHAAKGLEFETVILPDLAFGATGNSDVELFLVDEPPSSVMRGRAESLSGHFRTTPNGEKLKKISTLREEAEMRRLFYVAVTRAKSEVVFVCDVSTIRNSGFFSCLANGFGFTKDSFAALWPSEPGARTDLLNAGGIDVPVVFERTAPASAESHIRKRLADPALERELAAGPLAATSISLPDDAAHLDAGDAAKLRAASRSRTAGILLHRVLERWDGNPAKLDSLAGQLAAESGVDSATMAKVRQRLHVVVRSPALVRLQAAETIGRELPVRYLDARGQLVEGRIDRLLREAERLLVVDYKSGKPLPARLEHDREQVARYCRAIESITGEPCSGLLWYIDLETDTAIDV